jgi:hypothetical protein
MPLNKLFDQFECDLYLFPHLKGYKVLHGSHGYENEEVIKSIRTDRIMKSFITLEFESGSFTFISKEDFDKFLEDGSVEFSRAIGFTALESLIDLSSSNL